jgi:hypothetical protein
MQLDDLRRLHKLLRMPTKGADSQAAQRLKRSKVAKTSCLVPYPELPER